jgi:hypothetical protein
MRMSGGALCAAWVLACLGGCTETETAAEIELGVLWRQCLDRRMDRIEAVRKECSAWDQDRNAQQKGVDWRFTTADARIKPKRLYPQIQM